MRGMGTKLKTLGQSGGQVGPQIVYRIGTQGSLYGDDGWNILTDEPLWPWSNEHSLKSKISAYAAHGVNGKRGFCSDGVGLYGGPITLTSYIWEYLGNPCPADILSPPVPDIKANGSDGLVSIGSNDSLVVSVSLNDGNYSNQDADWWVVENGPDGWQYYDVLGGSWSFLPGTLITYQGPLFSFGSMDVLSCSGMTPGTYTFYFGIDMSMDGLLSFDYLYYDEVSVNVAD